MEHTSTPDGLRILRALYRVTQAEVARELRVSPARVGQLERAKPGSKSAERVASAILAAAARRDRGDE
jgi:transcriptional regulator with XRE-family HTH domain